MFYWGFAFVVVYVRVILGLGRGWFFLFLSCFFFRFFLGVEGWLVYGLVGLY